MKKKQYSDKPIHINNIDEVNQLKLNYARSQKIEFTCDVCKNNYIGVLANFKGLVCKKCNMKAAAVHTQDQKDAITAKRKATNLKKYGSESPLQNEDVLKRMKAKSLEKYGTEWAAQSDIVKNKINESIKEKYGSKENFNSFLKDRIENSIKEKYGYSNVSYIQSVIDKRKQTFEEHSKNPEFLESLKLKRHNTVERHSQEDPSYKEKVLEKRKQTLLQKYGVDHNFKIPEVIEHRKQYFIEKFGFENPAQNEQVKEKERVTISLRTDEEWALINKKRGKKLAYKNFLFDSWPEVCAYIYFEANNIDFMYKPEVFFEYLYDGKVHRYFPDFLVDDTLVEIKGNQFFEDKDPSKRMINPYNRDEDDLYEAKHLCMKQHNVIILTKDDYNVFVDYVENKLNLSSEEFIYEK